MSEEQNQGQPGQQIPGQDISSPGVQEQALHPHTSFWPFALAVALIIILMGIITNSIVLAIGAVLAAAAVIGWGLEHR